MTIKHKIFLTVGLFVIAGCWAAIAFFINDTFVSRFSLFASLVFGTGSIMVAVVALLVSVDSNRKAELLRVQKITEDANKFINDNNEEILYIPLCLIANAFDNHHKYTRKIFNEFNVLNKELQKEILKQLNYDYELINDNYWIDKEIKNIQDFVKKNDLGQDFLYDGAKYFHRALRYSSDEFDSRCEYELFMPDNFHWNKKIYFVGDKAFQENVSFDNYIDGYLEAKKSNSPLYVLHKNAKPFDVLAALQDLRNCDESKICYWVMQMIFSVSLIMQSELNSNNGQRLCKGDAEIKTFEDRYLECLLELYNLSETRMALLHNNKK